MKKINKSLFFLIILMMFSNTVFAENRIAYFDVEKVIAQSKVGKSIISQLGKIDKSNIAKFKKIEANIKDNENKLISKKNILAKKDFQNELNNLKKEVNTYKVQRAKNINEVSLKRVNATKKVLSLMNPIIAKYADENNISIILAKQNIVIGKTELDVTDEILILVNKNIKPFTLK